MHRIRSRPRILAPRLSNLYPTRSKIHRSDSVSDIIDLFLSHLLLVHNFRPEWIYQFNTPLWSIAVEAQLYLFFPLVSWAMIRSHPFLGAGLVIAAQGLIQGVVPFPFFQLAGSFITGMLVAHLAVTMTRLPRRGLLLAGIIALCVGFWLGPLQRSVIPKTVWLLGFSCLTLYLFHAPNGRWNVPTWAPVRKVGEWSYSLYAGHFPFLIPLYLLSKRLPLPYEAKVGFMFIVGSCLSLLVAWLMFITVERWSLGKMRRTRGRVPNRGISSVGP